MKKLTALIVAMAMCGSMTAYAGQIIAEDGPESYDEAYHSRREKERERELQRIMEEEGGIFAEGLCSFESLTERSMVLQQRGFSFHTSTREQEVSHVDRVMWESLTVSADAKIVDAVYVLVPKGMTLTVEKNATLTIQGALVVEGEFVNKGTVVVGNARAKENAAPAYLVNSGTVANIGAVSVVRGGISNEGTGMLTNKGTMTISNKLGSLTGLSNNSVRRGNGMHYGSIVNTGTIQVQNQGGVGILIEKDTTFDNQGTLTRAENATIKGTVSGNKPVAPSR